MKKVRQAARNLDLVVSVESLTETPDGLMPATLDLSIFEEAASMTMWEMACYTSYGMKRCEAEGIDTLEDLFGTNFSEDFFERKNMLIAKMQIDDLIRERDELQALVSQKQKIIDDYNTKHGGKSHV